MRAGERGGSPAALRGQERHCHRGDRGHRRRPPPAYGVGGLADGSVAGSEGRSPGVAPGLFGEGAVPSTEPRRMSGMPTAMPNVSRSPRMMTPRRTATSGLTYVITVEREGPTSRISAKNNRKASTVQTSASAATAPTVSAETVGAVAALALVCTVLAFLLFFALIREVGPSRSTVITYVNPLVAVLLGVIILGERLTLGIAVGMPLILLGSVLGTAPTVSAETDAGMESRPAGA